MVESAIEDYKDNTLEEMISVFVKKFYNQILWKAEIFPAKIVDKCAEAFKLPRNIFLIINPLYIFITSTSYDIKKKFSFNNLSFVYIKKDIFVMDIKPKFLTNFEQEQMNSQEHTEFFNNGVVKYFFKLT